MSKYKIRGNMVMTPIGNHQQEIEEESSLVAEEQLTESQRDYLCWLQWQEQVEAEREGGIQWYEIVNR